MGRTKGQEYKVKKRLAALAMSRNLTVGMTRTQVVQAMIIHDFKTQMDKRRYRERTTQV